MFCEKCGSQNPEDAKFCQSCGAPLSAAAPRPGQGGAADNRVRSLLRSVANGPLFLTGAVAYTAALLLQLVAAFVPGDGLGGTVYTVVNRLPSDLLCYAEDFGITIHESGEMTLPESFASTLLPTLSMMLPGLLTAIAVWMIFAAVRDATGRPIGTAGFTILKVLSILALVGKAVLLLAAEIGSGVLASLMQAYSSEDSVMPVFIVFMVLLAIGFGLAIFYNVQLVRTLNAMSDTAERLVPCGKVSVYVAVLCFIGIAPLLFGLALAPGLFDKLNILCLMVSQAAFAALLLDYRSKLKMLQPA